jgi:Trk K+ transport system NAD-binding subunit
MARRLVETLIIEAYEKVGRASEIKQVKELLLPHGSLLVLMVGKDGAPRVTTPESTLQAEDEVVAVTSGEHEDALRVVLTQS